MTTIFVILIVLFSAVIHEVAHGLTAYKLGDNTAKLAGRLTLNPIKHIDPFGSIILPFLISLLPGNFIIGWAKPVPYNPFNLKNPEKGAAQIAFAGPLSNILIAILFGIIIRIINTSSIPLNDFTSQFYSFLILIVLINISLAIFNLIPIPPLDGSKIMQFLIPEKFYSLKAFFSENNPYGFFILIIFIFFGISFISPIVRFLFNLFTGIQI